jgi:hypothetical protein
MNLDRMVFAPGDKVVRVGFNRHPNAKRFPGDFGKDVAFGVVYCVEDFWEGPLFNVIMLVGFGGWRYHHNQKVGYPASAFRKVEEIQICVKAAQQMKEKESQPA